MIQLADLTLNPKKCHFGYEELKFLGHVVSAKGVRPDPDKPAAVAGFPPSADKEAVRRFLGLCACYRRFIENFSKIAEPLTRLKRDDTPFTWTNEQQAAFAELRQRMQSANVLAHFDDAVDTEVPTEASNIGLGAVLVKGENGYERVIAYASRSLSHAEANYSTTEKECLAVVWAITKFRPYLYGCPFKVVTDHNALCWLANIRDPSGRLARWSLRLQEFDITIVYKSGRKHEDADTLSRAPAEFARRESENDDGFLGAMTASDLIRRHSDDSEIRPIIDHLEGHPTTIPLHLRRVLTSFVYEITCFTRKMPVRATEPTS